MTMRAKDRLQMLNWHLEQLQRTITEIEESSDPDLQEWWQKNSLQVRKLDKAAYGLTASEA